MTLLEINEMLEAFIAEEQRQDDVISQRLAWQTSHLMNSTGNYKKRIRPTDLYRPKYLNDSEPEQETVKRFNSKEEKEKYLKDLMKKFGK